MSGVAAAFRCSSSTSRATVYDRLRHMVPKLALRGQAGVGVAAFMHDKGPRYARALQSSCDALRIDCNEQDFRPHVAIAHICSRCRGTNDGSLAQPIRHNAGVGRSLAISLDGALVNARELRGELLSEGYRISDNTDDELLLKWVETQRGLAYRATDQSRCPRNRLESQWRLRQTVFKRRAFLPISEWARRARAAGGCRELA